MTSNGEPDSAAVEPGENVDRPILRATGLTKRFGALTVFASISFDVVPGAALALVGPNGGGKSTLLRCLAGTLRPDQGKVMVGGQPLREHEESVRRRVATVLDDVACFPDLTVREHLLLVAMAHNISGDHDALVDSLLREFAFSDKADVLPGALSSGLRRRLLLASAWARPRDVLLLDEPEQRLDPAAREHLLDVLQDEKDAGTALVFATHDLLLLQGLADGVLVLADGTARWSDPDAVAAEISNWRAPH